MSPATSSDMGTAARSAAGPALARVRPAWRAIRPPHRAGRAQCARGAGDPRPARRWGRRGDAGSMSLELAIVTPLLVGFMMLMVSLGRVVEAQSQVDGAARDAARAASVARDRFGAAEAARRAAHTTLGERDGGRKWCMSDPTVRFDSARTDWSRGGQVTIVVSCTIDLSGLSLIAVAPTKTVTGSATAPLDTLRRVE